MRISALAKRCGVSADTIRYYEQRGLIEATSRSLGNYRIYDQRSEQRLQFILHAKQLGFSLAEIEQLLVLQEGGARSDVRRLAQAHIDKIDLRIEALRAMRTSLSGAVDACDGLGAVAGCPIIDSIAEFTQDGGNEAIVKDFKR